MCSVLVLPMMKANIDLHEHISFKSTNTVERICRPLFENFNFNFFRYLVRFQDGKRVLLFSNKEALKYFYEDGSYAYGWLDGRPFDFFVSGVENWDINNILYGNDEISSTLCDICNLCASIEVIFKYKRYCEIFSFGSDNEMIYSCPQSVLRRFIFYFREQAKNLIRRSFQEEIILPDTIVPDIQAKFAKAHSVLLDSNVDKFISATPIDRFYLSEDLPGEYITKRELSCLYWILKGKTAEETGMILGAAKRTVEKHIENLKQKLDCYKQSAMVEKIHKLGIAEFVDVV